MKEIERITIKKYGDNKEYYKVAITLLETEKKETNDVDNFKDLEVNSKTNVFLIPRYD